MKIKKVKSLIGILLGMTLASAVSAAFLSGPDLPIIGQAAQTASGNNIMLAAAGTGSVNASGFRSFTIQIIPTGTVSSGVVTFEGSEDGTNFVSIPAVDVAAPSTFPVNSFTPATGTPRIFAATINTQYIRARISTIIGGGGSIAAVTRLIPTALPEVYEHAYLGAGTNIIGALSANQSVNAAQVAGTAVDTNSGGKSAGTMRVVLATDQPALTNKILVTPDSVALPANQSVNQTQWAGTAVDVNSGNKSAGTVRVILATDQPALSNKLLVTPDSVALPANQSVNYNQIGGTSVSVNSGITDAGTQRVTLSSDSTGQVKLATGANAIGTVTQGTAGVVTAGWPIINGEFATDTTGTFTNGTQTTSVTTGASIDGYATVLVTINGTYGTATAVFEMSDDGGTTWYSVSGVRTDSSVIEGGYTSLSNVTRGWYVSVAGTDGFRVRSTAVASGTVNVRFSISAAPVGLQSTSQLAAGTNIVGALSANQSVNTAQVNGVTASTGLGAADTGTQRFVQDTDMYFTGQAAQTATVNNIVPAAVSANATDLTGFQSGSVQITSTGTGGTFIFEGSNDNTNFQTVPVFNQLSLTGSPTAVAITASSSQIIYVFPVSFRYFRVRIATTITGGSIQAFSTFKHAAWSPALYVVGQSTPGNLTMTASLAAAQTLATVTTVSTLSNTTQLTPGTAATNLGKAVNNAPGATDTAIPSLHSSRPTLVATTVTATNYDVSATTKYRAQYVFDQEKNLPTYRASTAAGGIALAAAATDIAILPGNATNNVFVTKITVSGVQTTAGEVLVNIIKRSAANSAGTSAAMTSVPLDSGDAAASSLPLSYTANPTPGATVGIVDSAYVQFSPAATGVATASYVFNFGERGKGIKLSGVAQGLAVNLNGATVTGGNAVITFEFREEL